jgi:hypothetical protein
VITIAYITGTGTNTTDNGIAVGSNYTIRDAVSAGLPVDPDYSLEYWSERQDGGGDRYYPGAVIVADHTMALYPQYKGSNVSDSDYVFSIGGDNLQQVAYKRVPLNALYTFESPEQLGFSTPVGYEFDGWQDAVDSTIKYAVGYNEKTLAELLGGKKQFIVYATWKRIQGSSDSYTIMYFYSDPERVQQTVRTAREYYKPVAGGYVVPELSELNFNAALPTYPGYTFVGWASKIDGTVAEYIPGHSYAISNHIQLFSVFRRDDPDKSQIAVKWVKKDANGVETLYAQETFEGDNGQESSIVSGYGSYESALIDLGWKLVSPGTVDVEFGSVQEVKFVYEIDTANPKTHKVINWVADGKVEYTKTLYGEYNSTATVRSDDYGYNTELIGKGYTLNTAAAIYVIYGDGRVGEFGYTVVKSDDGGGSTKAPSYGGPNTSVNIPKEELPLAPPILTSRRVRYLYGYPDGTIRPDNTITRAEVASIFHSLIISTDKEYSYETAFTDVDSSEWYYDAVSYLSSHGILSGYEDGTYRPDQPITKAEITKVAVSFGKLEDYPENTFADINEGSWEAVYVSTAVSNGWVDSSEDGTFGSNEFVTRAQVVAIVNKVLNRSIDYVSVSEASSVYVDVSKDHWAYYEILEASIQYEQIETYAETQDIEAQQAAEEKGLLYAAKSDLDSLFVDQLASILI